MQLYGTVALSVIIGELQTRGVLRGATEDTPGGLCVYWAAKYKHRSTGNETIVARECVELHADAFKPRRPTGAQRAPIVQTLLSANAHPRNVRLFVMGSPKYASCLNGKHPLFSQSDLGLFRTMRHAPGQCVSNYCLQNEHNGYLKRLKHSINLNFMRNGLCRFSIMSLSVHNNVKLCRILSSAHTCRINDN